jgi:hypothetical protein
MKQVVRAGVHLVNSALRPVGVQLAAIQRDRYLGIDPRIPQIYERVKNLTQTSRDRVFCLCEAVQYITKAKVAGDFVECGVFKAGSSMAAALMMLHVKDCRTMHLYDTFTGMPTPSEKDFDYTGRSAFDEQARHAATGADWTKAEEHEVTANMASTGYDMSRVILHKGMVEATIPNRAPDKIAILRLDTDWYESTKHELQHLWPRLSSGGVLIIDDYGHFTGARDAVDEFFAEQPIFLFRIDYTGRMAIKH